MAIQGIGGVGHLGVQYAAKLGYRVAAIARGSEKASLAEQLGADHYIDSVATSPAAALQELGGAAGIVATASNAASMSRLLAAAGPARKADRGRRCCPNPLRYGPPTSSSALVRRSAHSPVAPSKTRTTCNWRGGHGIRSMNEIMAFSEAPKAYERMMSGKARFHVVLDMA